MPEPDPLQIGLDPLYAPYCDWLTVFVKFLLIFQIELIYFKSRMFLYRSEESTGSVGTPVILSFTNLILFIGEPA
jgi:hypothetical protein